MSRQDSNPLLKMILGSFLAGASCLLWVGTALAETLVCPGPDRTELFTDRSGPGCRKFVEKNSVQIYQGTPRHSYSASAPLPVPPSSAFPEMKPSSFPAVRGQVPILMVNKLSSGNPDRGTPMANAGEMAWVDLAINYLEAGTGPEATTDSHFGESVEASLRNATIAAGKAVGYDPRFLKVHLSIRTSFLHNRLHIDGPSAGVVMAVGIASALLGDSLRPDVCMSGTMNPNLEVGPVGGLEEKIKGCNQFNHREMILPSGQTSMDLTLKGMGYRIKLTEVSTLAEAYQAATGLPIRLSSLQ
jgi:hypothetical protein